jgi:hypothetical protein
MQKACRLVVTVLLQENASQQLPIEFRQSPHRLLYIPDKDHAVFKSRRLV